MAKKKKATTDRDSDDDYETEAEVDAADDAEAAEYARHEVAADRVKRDYEADTGADDGERVEVTITVDHIFLPLDAKGNVPANWAEAGATVRVGKGTKLTVPGDMLEALAGKVEVSS